MSTIADIIFSTDGSREFITAISPARRLGVDTRCSFFSKLRAMRQRGLAASFGRLRTSGKAQPSGARQLAQRARRVFAAANIQKAQKAFDFESPADLSQGVLVARRNGEGKMTRCLCFGLVLRSFLEL